MSCESTIFLLVYAKVCLFFDSAKHLSVFCFLSEKVQEIYSLLHYLQKWNFDTRYYTTTMKKEVCFVECWEK